MKLFGVLLTVAGLTLGSAQATTFELVNRNDGSTAYNGIYQNMDACTVAQNKRNQAINKPVYECLMMPESGSPYNEGDKPHYDAQHKPRGYDIYDNRIHGYHHEQGQY